MKIAVTGASGLIGSALVPALRISGHDVVRLVRHDASAPDEVSWDPGAHRLDPRALADVDAVVHLAGAAIAGWLWTPAYRRTITRSRVDGTTTLAEALAAAQPRTRVLISASGINYYGETGERTADESRPSGEGFLAEVCRQWEAATAPAEQSGVRVVHLRTGIVLARDGGALAKQLPLFQLGLGGPLGSGDQFVSWITLRDHVRVIEFLLAADTRGPVNSVAPGAVTNREFARALAAALHRPAVLRTPAWPLRLALRELAEETLLADLRVAPAALLDAGFDFLHPELTQALDAVLRPRPLAA